MAYYYKTVLALTVVLATPGFRAAPGPQLRKTLAEARMTLTPPPGWQETPVVPNGQMSYDYALRYPGRRLEVRYAVRPLAGMLAEYARSKKDKRVRMVDPNGMYEQVFRTIMLNAGAGNPTNPDMATAMQAAFAKPLNAFPPAAVKAEFGADWGAVQPLVPGPEFGQAYQRCVLVGLHKAGAADAYVFYLFDEQKDFTEVVFGDPKKLAFHSLRFQ